MSNPVKKIDLDRISRRKTLSGILNRFFYRFIIFQKIHNFFYSIKRGIKNLFIWKKVIWKDQDYDSQFLINIIIFKLNKMEKFFRSNNISTTKEEAEEVANEIMRTRQLLIDSTEKDYSIEINPNINELISQLFPFSDQENLSNKQEIYDCLNLADEYSKRDQKLAFEIILKNLDNWWD